MNEINVKFQSCFAINISQLFQLRKPNYQCDYSRFKRKILERKSTNKLVDNGSRIVAHYRVDRVIIPLIKSADCSPTVYANKPSSVDRRGRNEKYRYYVRRNLKKYYYRIKSDVASG